MNLIHRFGCLLALTTAIGLAGCKQNTNATKVKILGGTVDDSKYTMAIGVRLYPRYPAQDGDPHPFHCTGSVLSDRLVMFAAHCIYEGSGQDGNVQRNTVAYVYDTLPDGPLTKADLHTATLIVFPGWNPQSFRNCPDNSDVAFAVFPPLTFPVGPKMLLGRISETGVKVGQTVHLVGYGNTEAGDNNTNSEYLRYIGSNTVARIDDNNASLIILDTATISPTTAGADHGDSGGPLFDDDGAIVGIDHTVAQSDYTVGNKAISASNVHRTQYVNVMDQGISCFIHKVLTDPNGPRATSGQDCTATKI